ncbi:MAG: phage tail length tape measure family protein, partial [Alphaproteobacteria bacterium]
MARRFTFRLDSEGVEALKRDLEALGPAGTQAFDRLKRSSPQLASALDKAGDSADRVRKRIEQAGNRPPAALKALARAGDEASRSMEGLARHSGPIGSFLGALGPWGIAAAAGIGAVSLGLGKAVTAGLEFEKLQHQIQQLLLTTRGASGQTAAGIEEMAQRIARATLASTREVREAAAGLLTFRAIGGEAFERTLVAAQDLGSLGFGSLRSASVMLAKALEDPVRGTSQLREVGVSFSKDQEQVIKKLAETGRTAEAQAKILDIVEGQVAGAGAAQAGGLAGAFDSLGQAVQNFLEIAADRTGVLETLAGGIRGIASAIDAANESLTPEGRVAALEAEIARRQGRIDEMRTPQGEIGFVFAETNVGRQRVAAEQRRIDALRAERDPLARGLARDAEDLEEGRLMAEARAREERERTRLEERKKVFREIADAQARELQLAAMTSEERARQAAGDKAVEQARKRLVDLTEAEARSIRAGAVAAHDAKQAEAERSKFVGDIIRDLERGIEADAKRERTLARHIVGLETAATLESLSGVEKEVQR